MAPRWGRVAAAAAGGVAAGTAAVVALGTSRWNRETARAVARLAGRSAGRSPTPSPARFGATTPRFTPAQLEGLPASVARYFVFALTPGEPLARRARIRHAGEFAASPDAWRPFTSVEHFAVEPRGFVWDARIRMAPLVSVRVRDSYFGGEGAMRASAAAVVPVVNEHGTRAMAEASLQRYLAESAWLPTALLPDAGVLWTALDDRTARATLTDHGVTATVDFHFGGGGEIVRTSAIRYRDVRGTPVPTLWVGHSRDYARVNGSSGGAMMVPMAGEVEWVLADGSRLPYWRGRITDVAYDAAP